MLPAESPVEPPPNASPLDPLANDPSATSLEPFYERLQKAAAILASENLAGVFVIHGTFAGPDSLGLLTELGRVAPNARRRLTTWGKRLFDQVAGEIGNYTPAYCHRFERGLSLAAGERVPVHRLLWSSQNNHLGRADAALRLLSQIADAASGLPKARWRAERPPGFLLWAHSHGGNAVALVSQLLAADADARAEFFAATRSYSRRWCRATAQEPHWDRAPALLADAAHPLRRVRLDVATFGTPIRYGWARQSCGRLVHFINHRPSPKTPEYLAPSVLPPRPLRVLRPDGDYVQQMGIAGTNLPPFPLAFSALVADVRLDRLLERNLRRELLLQRFSRRARVPDAGHTLLVDYDPDREARCAEPWWGRLFGHGVYTQSRWLPWHLEQFVSHAADE